MYILWEPYKDGYTVKDTKDGVIEYFPKPILRRLFRKGIEIKGITCDEKNVIHFNAQHSKTALKKQSSAVKAKLLLLGKVKIVESTKKVYFNLDGTEGAFKVPFIGDYQYVIKLKGLGSIASQPYGLYFDDAIKNISFGISDMLDVIIKIPKSATYVGFGRVYNVRNLTIDFNHVAVAPCGKINANCDVRIFNYTAGSIYYPDCSRLSACANVWLEVPKGITHLVLDYLQFIPSVLQIPKHVKTFSTDSTYCRITSLTKGEYTKASDYLKRAEYAYNELFNKSENIPNFQKARNYLLNEENIDVFKEAPYIIIIEDPRVTKLDTDLRGVVLVIPKGTRSYIGENVDFRYNIILEV